MTDLTSRIIEAVKRRSDAIADLTAELVAIPTENPPGVHYAECVETLSRCLEEQGLRFDRIDVPGDYASSRRSILLVNSDPNQSSLVFHGHYDVVPADSPSQFSPVTQGNALFGRGTADMKGGVAAMIHAAAALREVSPELGHQVALTIVPDEETGGVLGSGYLQRQGLLGRNAIGMLTPEPTSGVVWHACRGALTLKVTVRGRYAHVGHHYAGVNAFEQMVRIAADLNELRSGIESRTTGHSLASEPDPDRARSSILMLGGLVEGGTSFNAVPSHCSFTIERRFNPEEDRETERARLYDLLALHQREGVELDIDVLQDAPSAASPIDDPLAEAVAMSTEHVLGVRPAFEMCPGLLEIRWYAQQGVPAYAFGPGLLSVSHGPEEYIDLPALTDYATIYALTAATRLSTTGDLRQ